jgi:chromosome segregation ATPase
MTEQQLLTLKKEIDEAKTEVAELQGQYKALMKQLKDDWGCDSIEAAEKLLNKKDSELSKLATQIESGLKELEEKYYE